MFAMSPYASKPKSTYDSLVQVIANQPMIAYPDRRATIMDGTVN